jgi:folate-binding protein YgfZ
MPTPLEVQLATIREAAGIFPIADRAFLRITGPDATRWLNGMVTNNIKDLAPGQGNYNFLLNAQGRIQGDCTIYRDPTVSETVYLLETDATQIEVIQRLLDKFIIMDDVELTAGLQLPGNLAAQFGISLIGTTAPELLLRAITDCDRKPVEAAPAAGNMISATANGCPLLVFAAPNARTPAFEIWCGNATEEELVRSTLLIVGAKALSPEAQEAHRVLSATPRFGQDIRNTETAKDLPQETAQTHALHFSKGCYLGQEIVERIHSRGNVHRTFTQFHLTGDLPKLPSPLEANEKAVGELTSAVQIGDQIVALGYIRREALETKRPLTYAGGTAQPTTA